MIKFAAKHVCSNFRFDKKELKKSSGTMARKKQIVKHLTIEMNLQ